MKPYDYLIVGSGLFGAVFAHEAHKTGRKCLVIEKRTHTGGNIYCEEVDGINVHKYGAHISIQTIKKCGTMSTALLNSTDIPTHRLPIIRGNCIIFLST